MVPWGFNFDPHPYVYVYIDIDTAFLTSAAFVADKHVEQAQLPGSTQLIESDLAGLAVLGPAS